MADDVKKSIVDSMYPAWRLFSQDWVCWRDTFNGGVYYRNQYLKKFSTRETEDDYQLRLDVTPIPTFAKAALLDIRNAIFQRMRDVMRKDGSVTYRRAVAGVRGGVDRRGSSMNSFIGSQNVLTELLLMGKVGVYVDNAPIAADAKQSDTVHVSPYLYAYPIEDVRNFSMSCSEGQSQFKTLLLRDTVQEYDSDTGLPEQTTLRYRYLWIDERQKVSLQFYNEEGNKVDRNGLPDLDGSSVIRLELDRIPFVLLDIGDGLLKDVCTHQIALLNLGSSDVSYALRGNFAFFTRQTDGREGATHLKGSDGRDNTGTAGGQGAAAREVRVGTQQGMTYGKDMERPGFINPSSEPLEASRALQGDLKADIRALINLAVTALGTRQSADSKAADNQGLEAGLSYIGLVLEGAERLLADYWAAYEEKTASKRQIPTIKYPDRYSLKTDADRIDESTKLTTLMAKVPSQLARREIAKCTVQALLGGRVASETIDDINAEIDSSPFTTSDPDTIIKAVENGLCGDETGSLAIGFKPGEHVKARACHALRVARIVAAQTDAGARGVDELSANPQAASLEKEGAADVTLNNDTTPQVRGEGR
jgi:hypothetical protein